MTIHSDHPFATPESERDPVRRFRGRVGGTVSLWTTGASDQPKAGLTVSSFLVAAGEPAHIIALLDPDSDLADALPNTRVAVVQLLQWQHQRLADAFAGLFPAPGGPFRLAEWTETPWGLRLATAPTWAGVRLRDDGVREIGWALLADCVVEHVEVGEDSQPLVHRRGRYQEPAS